MIKHKTLLGLLLALGLCLHAGAAGAHDLWLSCPQAKAGQKLVIEMGYGHKFPQSEPLDPKLVDELYVIGPQGKISTSPLAGMKYQSARPLAQGSYLVVGSSKPQWYSLSPDGWVNKPKNQVPEAIRCVRAVKYAKTLVNLGGKPGQVSKPVGQPLEIVPLADPAALKAGDELPVQVLLNGKPLAKAEVMATFAGFSREGAMAFYAKTDDKGLVKVKLWHPGRWLVRTGHKTPFKDPARCDTFSQGAALTFELK